MSLDELIAQAVKANPRRFLTEQILHAVVVQESEGVSTFERSDKQYLANMHTAMRITGRSEKELLPLVTLSDGRIAKFRCEPSIYSLAKFSKLPWQDRFNLSCSYGLFQVLGSNLLGSSTKNVKSTCLGFASNEEYQCLYAANSFEAGLERAYLSPSVLKKDIKTLVFRAYLLYNSGSLMSKDLSAQKRAQEVVSRL